MPPPPQAPPPPGWPPGAPWPPQGAPYPFPPTAFAPWPGYPYGPPPPPYAYAQPMPPPPAMPPAAAAAAAIGAPTSQPAWAAELAAERAGVGVDAAPPVDPGLSRLARDQQALRGELQIMGNARAPANAVKGGSGVVNPVLPVLRWQGEPWEWRPLVVALLPAFTVGGHTRYNIPPVAATQPLLTAPEPQQVRTGNAVAVIEWGAGGVRGKLYADWPALGARWQVNADYVSVTAQLRTIGVWAGESELPVFPANVAPGELGVASELTLTEVPQFSADGSSLNYLVPPFATAVSISIEAGTGDAYFKDEAADTLWWEPVDNSIWQPNWLPFPQRAITLNINPTVNTFTRVIWRIG